MFSKHFFYESTYGEGCFYEILNIDCLLFDFFKSFVKFNLTTNDVFARVGGINLRYVKCVRIWIFSGPYFPAFELNAYSVQMSENVDRFPNSDRFHEGPKLTKISPIHASFTSRTVA